jgi:hypothetical protein
VRVYGFQYASWIQDTSFYIDCKVHISAIGKYPHIHAPARTCTYLHTHAHVHMFSIYMPFPTSDGPKALPDKRPHHSSSSPSSSLTPPLFFCIFTNSHIHNHSSSGVRRGESKEEEKKKRRKNEKKKKRKKSPNTHLVNIHSKVRSGIFKFSEGRGRDHAMFRYDSAAGWSWVEGGARGLRILFYIRAWIYDLS